MEENFLKMCHLYQKICFFFISLIENKFLFAALLIIMKRKQTLISRGSCKLKCSFEKMFVIWGWRNFSKPLETDEPSRWTKHTVHKCLEIFNRILYENNSCFNYHFVHSFKQFIYKTCLFRHITQHYWTYAYWRRPWWQNQFRLPIRKYLFLATNDYTRSLRRLSLSHFWLFTT